MADLESAAVLGLWETQKGPTEGCFWERLGLNGVTDRNVLKEFVAKSGRILISQYPPSPVIGTC